MNTVVCFEDEQGRPLVTVLFRKDWILEFGLREGTDLQITQCSQVPDGTYEIRSLGWGIAQEGVDGPVNRLVVRRKSALN